MKKLFTLLLILMLIVPLTACTSTKKDPYIVGIATISTGATWEIQKKYFEEELGPKFNIKFIFSEVINDADGLMTFMENAFAQGAQGIINYRTNAIPQAAAKAQELEMYLINIASKMPADVQDDASLTYTIGNIGASVVGIAAAYTKAIDEVLSDGQNHSLVVVTGAAVGQAAASHYFSTKALLEGMQAKYNLTYSDTVDNLINNATPSEIETGNDAIKIFLVPGVDVATITNTISPKLQSGEYDVFAAVFGYANYTSLITEVEAAQNVNVKIIATTSIEAQTATGFETKDKFGDSILSAGILNPLNVANGPAVAMMFNALTGHVDAMKNGGKPVQLYVNPWVVFDSETYVNISKLDASHETYVLSGEDLDLMTVNKDSKITYKDFETKLTALADIDAIIANKLK
jgi:hypothetical protein